MILKGSQRGGAKQLGLHLLKPENEHVEVHEISGFMAETVLGAMQEAWAISRGTKCKQFLFSVSLNPPSHESVRTEVFEQALDKIEERTGLSGQPRIVVFHEKEGRRHAHCVWSRIDAETMTAKPLSFFKTRLREVSKELYIEQGWQMPRGLMDSKARDPRNFSLAEWQQAKRAGANAKDIKATVQECWAVSDSRDAFAKAMEERGLYLARGDRRAHVAVGVDGEVFSIARLVDKRVKDVAAKLGPADGLRSVDETKVYIADLITPRLKVLMAQAKAQFMKDSAALDQQRRTMSDQHARERGQLDVGLEARRTTESAARAARFRKGLAGLWDRMRGEHARIKQQNEMEAHWANLRDREQRHALITAQMQERQSLQQRIVALRQRQAERLRELHRDVVRLREAGISPQSTQRPQSNRASSVRKNDISSPVRPGAKLESDILTTEVTKPVGQSASHQDRLAKLREGHKPELSKRDRGPTLEH